QGVLRRRPRPAVARLTERSLAGEEAAELPSNGLDLLAAAARRVEQRRRSLWITPQEIDERERVRVEVGIDGAPDRDGALVLKPAVSRQPYEGVAGGWILGPSIAPGTKVTLPPRDDEPPHSGLQVDQECLKAIRRGDHLLRMPGLE